MKTISINKPRGITPLQAVQRLKELRPTLKNEKMSYAGRLDPMAQGLLILLIGDENKKRHTFEDLTKTYEFSILFGISTDTYDVLGRITKIGDVPSSIDEQVKTILHRLTGEMVQEYPPFSSQTIEGKPMYYLARNNLLEGKKIPTKKVALKSLEYLRTTRIPRKECVGGIIEDIKKVVGDFRQEVILKDWGRILGESGDDDFIIVTLRADVTSGTYIRSLAHKIGEMLHTPALAYSIIRTRVGTATLEEATTL